MYVHILRFCNILLILFAVPSTYSKNVFFVFVVFLFLIASLIVFAEYPFDNNASRTVSISLVMCSVSASSKNLTTSAFTIDLSCAGCCKQLISVVFVYTGYPCVLSYRFFTSTSRNGNWFSSSTSIVTWIFE